DIPVEPFADRFKDRRPKFFAELGDVFEADEYLYTVTLQLEGNRSCRTRGLGGRRFRRLFSGLRYVVVGWSGRWRLLGRWLLCVGFFRAGGEGEDAGQEEYGGGGGT